MGTFAIWIIAVVAIAGGILFMRYKKAKDLQAAGKTFPRKGAFWEEESIFTTSATYASLAAAVQNCDFSECRASVTPDFNDRQWVYFTSSNAWTALLEYSGEQEGRNLFKFSFMSWETHNEAPRDINSMNMVLTSVEKLFLALDPEALVQTQPMQIKSRTHFL